MQPQAAEPALLARLPVPVRRQFYRAAYQGLRVWWFLFRPQVAGVKCVLTHRDRVLLVRHTYGPRGWDLPGGTAKPKEAPADTATREIAEELGLQIEDWQPLGELDHVLDHRRDRLHCFAAELGERRLTVDPGELAAAQWFPRHQLPRPLNYYVAPILARAGARGERPVG